MKKFFLSALLFWIVTEGYACNLSQIKDIYICIGQSNMAGRADIPDSLRDSVFDDVWLMNEKGVFEPATLPLNRYSNIRKDLSMQKLGLAWSFAQTMAEKTQGSIGLVVNARGGSSILQWEKGKPLYEKTMERIRQAQKFGRLKGIIWHQGESNCFGANKLPMEDYRKRIVKLVKDIRKEVRCGDLPVVVGQLGQWEWANLETIREFNQMLSTLPFFLSNCSCVSSDGLKAALPGTDDPHFGTEAQLELGRRYAKSMIELIFRLPMQNRVEIPLWQSRPPIGNNLSGPETDLGDGRKGNISVPSMVIYPANHPNGITVVMCPGGGYSYLATKHEGHDMASWFNSLGITFVVLQYRMPNRQCEVPISDVRQAFQLLRENAVRWNINPQHIGIMGASAGGHLAASFATLEREKGRGADFQILLYPVISMRAGISHLYSRQNLLGIYPDKDLEERFSAELQVTDNTPPAFIVLSADDKAVSPTNSLLYFQSLITHQIPVSLHIYSSGGHGWGFRDDFFYKKEWTKELEKWIQELYKQN